MNSALIHYLMLVFISVFQSSCLNTRGALLDSQGETLQIWRKVPNCLPKLTVHAFHQHLEYTLVCLFIISLSSLARCVSIFTKFGYCGDSLEQLNFSKNLSISSRLPILLQYSCSKQSHYTLYFGIVYCNLSFFISNFINLIRLFFY